MAYRNKTYICFDGDKDMHYYRLMTAWVGNDNCSFNFHNAHDLNTARDSSQEESIKRQLMERFSNSKQLIVLIGESTRFLTKFVKWEMEVALKQHLPIIAVNLNGSRYQDDRCPSTIRNALAIYVPFEMKVIKFAMDSWSGWHLAHRSQGKTGPYHYEDLVYRSLK